MNLNSHSGYYVDCLQDCIAEGFHSGNYVNAIADCILHNAQRAVADMYHRKVRDMEAYDVLAHARNLLRQETPVNPYWEDIDLERARCEAIDILADIRAALPHDKNGDRAAIILGEAVHYLITGKCFARPESEV